METYKDIKGYEGLYQVSNLGNVKSLARVVVRNDGSTLPVKERVLKGSVRANGYLSVSLRKEGKIKTYSVHQLVAFAFLNHKANGHKAVVNHIDFNRTNNNVENLETITQRQNTNQKHLKSTSKYTGVSFHKPRNKWRSQITINGKTISLGLFTDESLAAEYYDNALFNVENGINHVLTQKINGIKKIAI